MTQRLPPMIYIYIILWQKLSAYYIQLWHNFDFVFFFSHFSYYWRHEIIFQISFFCVIKLLSSFSIFHFNSVLSLMMGWDQSARNPNLTDPSVAPIICFSMHMITEWRFNFMHWLVKFTSLYLRGSETLSYTTTTSIKVLWFDVKIRQNCSGT